MAKMVMMAKTSEKSYRNNYQGEDWAVVSTCYNFYPSGRRECVRFPSGFECKIDRCEVCYVFEK